MVHAGDTVAKGSHKGSLAIIDYLTRHNITGVRGNHDQKVIEWKGWQDWFATLPGGNDWLSDLHSHWEKAEVKGKKLKKWVKNRRNESRGEDAKWWSLIPKQWIPFGDHYQIAKDLTDEQYSYFLSLPLKLHIPSAHAFIVHAGLLPYDLQYDFDDHKRQPLARAPRIRADISRFNQGNIDAMRTLQERSVLRRVPHNTDPWVNLNVRSVVKDRDLSRYVWVSITVFTISNFFLQLRTQGRSVGRLLEWSDVDVWWIQVRTCYSNPIGCTNSAWCFQDEGATLSSL